LSDVPALRRQYRALHIAATTNAVPRPREGGLRRGENVWLRFTTASAQWLRLPERF